MSAVTPLSEISIRVVPKPDLRDTDLPVPLSPVPQDTDSMDSPVFALETAAVTPEILVFVQVGVTVTVRVSGATRSA